MSECWGKRAGNSGDHVMKLSCLHSRTLLRPDRLVLGSWPKGTREILKADSRRLEIGALSNIVGSIRCVARSDTLRGKQDLPRALILVGKGCSRQV